jgi:hypothetical protein
MPSDRRILQIVPQLPGSYDGVGDYALTLARSLFDEHGLKTVFAVAGGASVASKDGFEVVSGLSPGLLHSGTPAFDHVILHYANYGYQARGMPFRLRDFAQQLRRMLRGQWITMFHELYASGPPWRSAFWVRPFQVKIARDMMDLSDRCFVSNCVIEAEIRRHDLEKSVRLLPVMSNFGEPRLTDFSGRSPRRWAICGGTALVARSLRSFAAVRKKIPPEYSPQQLDVIGGRRDAHVRALVKAIPDISCNYHPEFTVDDASQILAQCSFGWLDYFGTGTVWPGMIFKSGSFAAFCAHGIVPVLSHDEKELAVHGDKFSGPFGMSGRSVRLPQPEQLAETQREIFAWYHRHASAAEAARAYAEALA